MTIKNNLRNKLKKKNRNLYMKKEIEGPRRKFGNAKVFINSDMCEDGHKTK